MVRTCLAKDPDDRFQSARDLKRSLELELGRFYAGQIAQFMPEGGVRLGGVCQGGRVIEEKYPTGELKERREVSVDASGQTVADGALKNRRSS